jgi:hypothetical protein
VLVIVEDRDIQLLLEPFLDLETPGGSDIFQVYPAEARGEVLYRGNDLLGIRGV